jgi:hypothetical protein
MDFHQAKSDGKSSNFFTQKDDSLSRWCASRYRASLPTKIKKGAIAPAAFIGGDIF